MCVCEIAFEHIRSCAQHFPKYFAGYFPNEGSFSFFVLVSYPPVLAMGVHPSSPLQWEIAALFALILLMREIAIIVGVSFDPQQMKTKRKKTFKLLRQRPFSFTSFFVSWLILCFAALKTCNVREGGQ